MDAVNSKWVLGLHDTKFHREMRNIERIEIPEDNAECKSVDGLVYTKDGKRLIFCPPGRAGHVDVAPVTESIGAYLFTGTKVGSVTLPEGVKTIERYAFDGRKIQEIRLPASVKSLQECNFGGAKIIHLESGKPIRSLLDNIMQTEEYYGWRTSDIPYIIVDMAGHPFALPTLLNEKAARKFLDAWRSGQFLAEGADKLYKAAQKPEDKQDTALAQWRHNQDSKDAGKYAKYFAGRMAERYIKDGNVQNLNEILSTGWIPKNTLKNLLEVADGMDDMEAKALLLEAVSKTAQKN